MSTQNIEILHKIIELQSCIIQGRSIKAMLHKDKDFYREKTGADIIAIYVNENEKVALEYVVEDHHHFKELAQEYIFSEKTLTWDDFMNNCRSHFTLDKRYHHTKDFSLMFKGLLSQKSAQKLSKELQIQDVITMPFYDFAKKNEIGYVCFMFQDECCIEISNLLEIQNLFETILRPLYDRQQNIIYSKCVRVDEEFKLLTEQEKRIVKKVLEGKTYPQIAEMFHLSINTIKTHMKNIFKKYQIKSKIELYNKLTIHP